MEYRLDYGRTTLTLDLDPSRVAEISPQSVTSVLDLDAAAREAAANPQSGDSLSQVLEGQNSALILTVDHTRPSPRPLLDPILDACRDADVRPTIMVAIGRHRQMTDDELVMHFGQDLLDSVEVVQHDPFDRSAHEHLGETSRGTPILVNRAVLKHDVVLGTSFIEPSYLCGWSGGRKLLMPGVAFHEAIDANHYWLTQPGAVIGTLDGNPVSEDALEFARACPPQWLLCACVGPEDEIFEFVAGDPLDSHRQACDLTRSVYEVAPPPADIVITSAGGWPYDCDLVQAKKAIIPAAEIVRDGGAIVLLADCVEGLGAEDTFIHWLTTMTPHEVAERVLDRGQFSLGAHGANILAKPMVTKDAEVIVVTRPEIREALAGSFLTIVTSLDEAWERAVQRCGADADVALVRKARRLIVN